jgi:hypothetical protein
LMDEQQQMVRNQRAWEAQTAVHFESDFYDVASFRKGRNTLRPFEQEALGDVRGRSLLHLMRHFGLDTLSWARLGAEVTGVDFSKDSIATATALAGELRIEARFLQANVYDLPRELDESFAVDRRQGRDHLHSGQMKETPNRHPALLAGQRAANQWPR